MGTWLRWLVLAFVLLLLVAALPPLVGAASGPLSPALPYAWFHLGAALVGLVCLFRGGRAPAWFALGFGLVDLYQALASLAGWFPQPWFQWTRLDDELHIVLGTLLAVAGCFGLTAREPRK